MALSGTLLGVSRWGDRVYRYTMHNQKGMRLDVLNLGGIIQNLWVPDREGHCENIVLGYRDWRDYEQNEPHFGALIGRCANRIAGSRFTLDGELYRVSSNEGRHHLHGGKRGFHKRVFTVDQARSTPQSVVMSYHSSDGEEGYPGALQVEVTYALSEEQELSIHYRATADRSTILNMTQHSYFNLKGEGHGTILDHELAIASHAYTPIDQECLPTGEIADLAATPLDFRRPKALGMALNGQHEQIKYGKGCDHNFVLDGRPGSLRQAADLREATTGRRLTLWTTLPGMQLYTGQHLNQNHIGPRGAAYQSFGGVCLETQNFPDSPNQGGFPSVTLRPGQSYDQTTLWRFSTLPHG